MDSTRSFGVAPCQLLLAVFTLTVAVSYGSAPLAAARATPGAVLVRVRADVAAALGGQQTLTHAEADVALARSTAPDVAALRPLLAPVANISPISADTYSLRGDFDPARFAAALAATPAILYAEPDHLLHILKDSTSDPYFDSQWALRQIKATDAWDTTTGSASITIAILDTGIAETHPDLQGKVLRGYNVLNDSADTTDDNGHGTYVAGIAAARGDNNVGIAGVDWAARLLPVKIADATGAATNAAMARGIRYAADNDARVVNISLGGPDRSQVVEDAVRYALAKGVVIVASAGNEGKNTLNYPAAYDGVIAVGASTEQDTPASFSDYGSALSLLAPGVNIVSDDLYTDNPTPYSNANGTSSAAPFVTGTVGLMLSVAPNLTPTAVKGLLAATADDIAAPGFDTRSGWGRLNTARAVAAAQSGTPATVRTGQIRGRVVGDINPADVVVTLTPGDSRIVGADGYSFADLPPGTYSLTARADKYGLSLAQPISVTITGGASDIQTFDLPFPVGPILTSRKGLPVFRPVSPLTAAVRGVRYFAQTGHTLHGSFRTFWEASGGLAVFGYPLSEEFVDNGLTVQYFERARFEYHPEFAGTPNKVTLGLLGSGLQPLVAAPTNPFAWQMPEPTPATNTNGSNTIQSRDPAYYVVQTGHTIGDEHGFLHFWQTHGGLPIFGNPISEEFREVNPDDGQTYIVQYFERARLEYHPDADPAQQVQIGRVGAQYAAIHAYLSPATRPR